MSADIPQVGLVHRGWITAAHRGVGDIPQIEPSFRNQLLSALLEGSANLEFASGGHGQNSGQCAHDQAAADALVAARRTARASSESCCD